MVFFLRIMDSLFPTVRWATFSNSEFTTLSEIFTKLEFTTSARFWGLIIDEKLSWNVHIDNICKIIARSNGILSKLRHFRPRNIMLSLYSTLILPYLNYWLIAWGSAATFQINRLSILQKERFVLLILQIFEHTRIIFFWIIRLWKLKTCIVFSLDS